jgi:exopolyphosphatase/guanosine-5'-triphosphate,3'-diphosphate pyrophosphatase
MMPDDIKKSAALSTRQNAEPDDRPIRIALFDIGTNSIKFLIAEIASASNIRKLYFSRTTTRLGAGLEHDGRIRRQALDRTVQAIATYQEEARKYGCGQTFAFATHVLRTAVNADAIVAMIEQQTGIHLRILTGGEEAFYAFISARNRVTLTKPHTVLLDIGGGSTEFVHAHKLKIQNANSLPLGAISLTEKYLVSNPVAAEEYNAMNTHIEQTVRRSRILDAFSPTGGATLDLVISGGAIWTLTQMIYHAEGYSQHSTLVNKIKRHQLRSFLNKCISLTVDERKQIEGLEPDRADIIVAGLAIVDYFMRVTNKRVLIANEGGVREGVLQAIIENDVSWPEETGPMEAPPAEEPRS